MSQDSLKPARVALLIVSLLCTSVAYAILLFLVAKHSDGHLTFESLENMGAVPHSIAEALLFMLALLLVLDGYLSGLVGVALTAVHAGSVRRKGWQVLLWVLFAAALANTYVPALVALAYSLTDSRPLAPARQRF